MESYTKIVESFDEFVAPKNNEIFEQERLDDDIPRYKRMEKELEPLRKALGLEYFGNKGSNSAIRKSPMSDGTYVIGLFVNSYDVINDYTGARIATVISPKIGNELIEVLKGKDLDNLFNYRGDSFSLKLAQKDRYLTWENLKILQDEYNIRINWDNILREIN